MLTRMDFGDLHHLVRLRLFSPAGVAEATPGAQSDQLVAAFEADLAILEGTPDLAPDTRPVLDRNR